MNETTLYRFNVVQGVMFWEIKVADLKNEDSDNKVKWMESHKLNRAISAQMKKNVERALIFRESFVLIEVEEEIMKMHQLSFTGRLGEIYRQQTNRIHQATYQIVNSNLIARVGGYFHDGEMRLKSDPSKVHPEQKVRY